MLSLYDQHGLYLTQVKGVKGGDGGPGDGVNLHQQPQHLAQTFWEHCGGKNWRILPDLDFRHKERGSNGGLDDGLKVLPRLFTTPLDHLEILIHLRTLILINHGISFFLAASLMEKVGPD